MGRATSETAAVLLIDKPAGPTSHDVVRAARRALNERRIGHAGTLDPFATGLLLLCVGPASRLSHYLHLLPKRYEAELRLGVDTDTHDLQGTPIRESEDWRTIEREQLMRALAARTGVLMQRPPLFSAKRVEGRRAYAAARRGERIELEPARVHLFALDLLAFDPPLVRVAASVSTGTYVRALARDLGRDLGCFAHLTALRRTEVGAWRVEDALPADRLPQAVRSARPGRVPWWLPPAAALAWLPQRRLGPSEALRVRSGGRIEEGRIEFPESGLAGFAAPQGSKALPVALLHRGRLLAVAAREAGDLQPRKVFPGE